MAPGAQRVVNEDVEQAEGAVRAIESQRSRPARGFLVTPWASAEGTAIARLDRVRLIRRDALVQEIVRWIDLLRDYRRGWSDEAAVRESARHAVEPHLPKLDWLWQVHQRAQNWANETELASVWPGPAVPLTSRASS